MHPWRSGPQSWSGRPRIPLSAYFLVPPLMYHFVLVSCLLLLIVDVLRSRA
jgi:hypothetical protein